MISNFSASEDQAEFVKNPGSWTQRFSAIVANWNQEYAFSTINPREYDAGGPQIKPWEIVPTVTEISSFNQTPLQFLLVSIGMLYLF